MSADQKPTPDPARTPEEARLERQLKKVRRSGSHTRTAAKARAKKVRR
ncbi:hypothetical protein [Streptomyces lydicus]